MERDEEINRKKIYKKLILFLRREDTEIEIQKIHIENT